MKQVFITITFILSIMGRDIIAQTWQFDQSPTRQNLARLDMLSDSLGWAVSYDGLILKYNGSKWSVAGSLDDIKMDLSQDIEIVPMSSKRIGDIYTIRITDKSNGWLAVNNIDKHNFWLIHFDPAKESYFGKGYPVKFRSIDFWDKNSGMAVGEEGGYYYDRGDWKQLELPITVDFKCVKYIKKNKLFMCGDLGTLILKERAITKIIETPHAETLRDMDFISETEGWIVGHGGTILHYKDGQVEQELAESTNNLWAVDMLSSSFGYAVGEKGTFLQYNGNYWDNVNLNSDVDFHDIEMLSDSLGFVVGGRGTILKYAKDSDQQSSIHQFLFSDQVHLGSENLMDRITDIYGVTVADFNNDLAPDIYLTGYKSLNHLLLNKGSGYYQNYVIESGIGGNVETRIGKEKYEYGSIAADFDRDNDTDLFLAGKSKTTRLFINNGDAIFEDATVEASIPENLDIIDGALGDFNEDGYPDLVLADENKGLRILLNQKYNQFSEQFLDATKIPVTGIRAVKTADLNGDFHQDILVIFQNKPPIILLNSGLAEWKYQENLTIGDRPGFVNSTTIADFNSDGFNDFFLCSEDGQDAIFIYNQIDQKFYNESEKWQVKQGGRSYSAICGDFNLDGYPDLYISRFGQDYLYINGPGSSFDETSMEAVYSKAGYLSGYNTGTALNDIDGNGTYDLVVGNAEYWSSLLENQIKDPSYISVNLTGVLGTREALGARVWIWPASAKHTPDNLLAHQEIILSAGMFSQNWNSLIIGLGEAEFVDLKVRFLNGKNLDFLNVKKGTELKIFQAAWFERNIYSFARSILQFLNTSRNMWEVFRLFVFALFIFASVRFLERRYAWRPAHATVFALALVSIYIFFMSSSGVVYYFLPFFTLAFVLGVLIVVNEPQRKTNRLLSLKQKKIHQAHLKLSNVPYIGEAFKIVCDAMSIIKPFNYCILYTYHPDGNYFLLKAKTGKESDEWPKKIFPKRKEVVVLKQKNKSYTFDDLQPFWPDRYKKPADSLVFPLVRKNELLGLIVLNVDEDINIENRQNIEDISNLFLQLAIALDNIRITRSLGEQEKIAAIGSFSSGFIHNLKNPIEGLRLIVEMLSNELQENDPKKEYVEELSNGILELKLKLLQSVEMVDSERNMQDKVMLNDILNTVINNYCNYHYVDFDVSLQDILYINGDKEKICFAFENIIQNAIEATKNSEPIYIKTEKVEKMAMIEIRDQGCGIPDNHFDKVFELFYSTRGKSRGMGLTLTKNIINDHGGYIDLYSKKNKGTRFRVYLPLTDKVVN